MARYVMVGANGRVHVLTGNLSGMREVVRSPMMHAGTHPKAEEIAARAAAIAPKGRPRKEGDGRGKPYAASFTVDDFTGPNRDGHVRAGTRVTNTSQHAFVLEYGRRNIPDPPRPLRRAAGIPDDLGT